LTTPANPFVCRPINSKALTHTNRQTGPLSMHQLERRGCRTNQKRLRDGKIPVRQGRNSDAFTLSERIRTPIAVSQRKSRLSVAPQGRNGRRARNPLPLFLDPKHGTGLAPGAADRVYRLQMTDRRPVRQTTNQRSRLSRQSLHNTAHSKSPDKRLLRIISRHGLTSLTGAFVKLVGQGAPQCSSSHFRLTVPYGCRHHVLSIPGDGPLPGLRPDNQHDFCWVRSKP